MRKKLTFALLMLLTSVIMNCESDHGLEPSKTVIKGRITFSGEWPAAPAEVRVISATKFPPSDIGDINMGDPIPPNATTYDYAYYPEPGSYNIIGVAWRPQGGTWSVSSICGIYFSGADSLFPGQVTVNAQSLVAQGIDISVNRSKARVSATAKISGKINFEGAWPESFSSALVVASLKNPLSESISLLDLSVGNTIAKGTISADYSINASAGIYRAVGVLFINADGTISEEALYYSQNVGGIKVQDITVAENATIAGPDFHIKIAEVESAIKGAITFSGQWPATAEEVRLIAATTFPPAIEELIIGDAIPPDAEVYKYTFKLRPANYRLIGVAWRAEGTNWDLLSICGAYFVGADSLAPGQVEIPSPSSVVENINMQVNRSKARKVTDTRILGTVQFNGTWPAEVTEARAIATTRFQIFPTILPTMLDLAFSDPIPPGTTALDYSIRAFPGKFAVVGVVFLKGDQQLTTNDILYSLQHGGLWLNELVVQENEHADGPDFVIRF